MADFPEMVPSLDVQDVLEKTNMNINLTSLQKKFSESTYIALSTACDNH